MHVDVVLGLLALVAVPVLVLVIARWRRTGGEAGVPSSPDRSVLHCAAPTPPTSARRP